MCHSTHPESIFVFKDLCIYLRGKVTERETEIFLLLVDPPQMAVTTEARVKPGTRNSIRVLHVDGRGPWIWAINCCFPRPRPTSRELDQKQNSWDSNWCSFGMPASLAAAYLIVLQGLAHELNS